MRVRSGKRITCVLFILDIIHFWCADIAHLCGLGSNLSLKKKAGKETGLRVLPLFLRESVQENLV